MTDTHRGVFPSEFDNIRPLSAKERAEAAQADLALRQKVEDELAARAAHPLFFEIAETKVDVRYPGCTPEELRELAIPDAPDIRALIARNPCMFAEHRDMWTVQFLLDHHSNLAELEAGFRARGATDSELVRLKINALRYVRGMWMHRFDTEARRQIRALGFDFVQAWKS